MNFDWRRVFRKGVAGVAAAFAVVLLGGALLHLPFAKPLLMKLGGCPMTVASPSVAQAARATVLRGIRGSAPAPRRPALGFVLGRSTTEDVLAWARTNGAACKPQREGTLVVCSHVSAASVGREGKALDQLAFLFRVTDKTLLNVTSTRLGLSTREAAELLSSVSTQMRNDLGSPTLGGDAPSEQALAGVGRGYLVEYRFRDYLADASAMSMGPRGVLLREHYVAIED